MHLDYGKCFAGFSLFLVFTWAVLIYVHYLYIFLMLSCFPIAGFGDQGGYV